MVAYVCLLCFVLALLCAGLEASKLAEIAQQKQEDWFALWVHEMIRIAKPGAPVIIEQVSKPYCNDMDDWGGVPHKFWASGIEKYGWNVDKNSLQLARDKVFKQRYNVFMQKNPLETVY